MAIYEEQVKSGGLFNSSTEPCLVLCHPEHREDYFSFCIRVKRLGRYAFVSIKDFGKSKQMTKANISENMKNDRKGKKMSYIVGSMLGQAIRTIGSNKEQLENETNYYQCLSDIFDEIVS
ncbi:MAG: hypothetical protein FWG34_06445 [Oscillospiraceae bacterium]|nr:hypothetical protein [Oscillospiraceae bacterium]